MGLAAVQGEGNGLPVRMPTAHCQACVMAQGDIELDLDPVLRRSHGHLPFLAKDNNTSGSLTATGDSLTMQYFADCAL